ncbi:hypothetical protein Hanom_Chr01g00080391 [Helianthus anomalus]
MVNSCHNKLSSGGCFLNGCLIWFEISFAAARSSNSDFPIVKIDARTAAMAKEIRHPKPKGWKPMGCGGQPWYDGITWEGNKSVDQNFGNSFCILIYKLFPLLVS